jgi:hypothetical protein
MTKEVATKKSTELALVSSFEDEANTGLEAMGQDDLALPFLKIMTNMSPELESIDGAKTGMIFDSVSSETFPGDEGVEVVPCSYQRVYIEWTPRGSGQGLVAVHQATSDILSRTHKQPGDNKDYLDNGNYIENTANYYVLYKGKEGFFQPAIISMKSTQLKKSRKWNSMMTSVKMQGANGAFTPPIYSQVYRLATTKESNDKGSWHGWEITRIGTIEDQGVFNDAKSFAASVSTGDVNVKYEGEDTASKETGENSNIF